MNLRTSMVITVAAVGLLVACRRSAVDVNPIVPAMDLSVPRAPLGSPLEVTYRWTVEVGATPIPPGHRAFVHFLDDGNKAVLFADDHVPVPPPDQWKAGETYSYKRTMFVPIVPYVGTAHLIMGVYPSTGQGHRVALKAEDIGMRAYKVGSMELLPQTENIFLVYKEGWHGEEAHAQNPQHTFMWTKKNAVVSFKNPKRDVIVYLEAETNSKAFPRTPVLTVSTGAAAASIPIESSEVILKKIRFTAGQLGTDEWVDLRLAMDQSFVPKVLGFGPDVRELGMLVSHLYVGEVAKLGTTPGAMDALPAAPTERDTKPSGKAPSS